MSSEAEGIASIPPQSMRQMRTDNPYEGTTIQRRYLASLTRDELVEVACALSADCDRLRRELDDLNGVIR